MRGIIKLHECGTEICDVLQCLLRCTCNNSLVWNQFYLRKLGNLNNSRKSKPFNAVGFN